MGQPRPLSTHKGKTCFRSLPNTSSPSQSLLHPTGGHPLALHAGSPTHVLPHRQVLLLLHIQHDLQPIARSALGGGEKLCPIRTRVEGVALTHPGKDLGVGKWVQTSPGSKGPSRANPGSWDLSLPPPLDFFFEHRGPHLNAPHHTGACSWTLTGSHHATFSPLLSSAKGTSP